MCCERNNIDIGKKKIYVVTKLVIKIINYEISDNWKMLPILTTKTRKSLFRSNHPEVILRKGVPKIYSKFTGEQPCRSVISIKLQSHFFEIALRHGVLL